MTRFDLSGRTVILLLAVATLAVAAAGLVSYLDYEQGVRADIGAQLNAVAELKAGELVQWRREREADARFFSENRIFADLVRRFLADRHDPAGEEIRAWFDRMRSSNRYARVTLLDPQGTPRLIDPPGHGPPATGDAAHADAAHESHRTGQVVWVDFHRNGPDDPVHLTLVAPLTGDDAVSVGAVALRIDPSEYLYPFIRRWPVPSATAETLLARRDGDDLLYLTPLRFREDAPLELRAPLSRADVPEVWGARGGHGVFEGVDYRDEPVIAAVRAVPGTPWILVARMDPSEAWAPVRARLGQTVLIGLLFLVAAGAGLASIWQGARARADEALRLSEQRYRQLFESNPHPMWVYDRDTLRFLAVNDAAVAHYGWSRDRCLAMTIADIHPAEDVPRLREHLARLPDGVRNATVWQHLKADGSTIDVEITSHALEFDGRAAMLVLAHDVTDHLRAEREIRELHDALQRQYADNATALARLHALIEASPTILYSLAADDPALPAAWVSDNITRILGYTVEEALSPGWWTARLHPDDREQARTVSASLATRDQAVHEYRFRDADGRYRRIRDEVRRGSGADIVGAWTDMTAQRQAEAQQHLQLSALEAAANAIVVTSTDGRIEWANPAFTTLTGYTMDEAVSRRPGELLGSGRHDAAFYQDMWRTILDGRTWQGEIVNRRKDGSLYDEEMTITPVRGASGAIEHFVAVKQDVSERKLLQAQLLQAQRMESVGRLAGGVAHDFNNLLTVINSYAELAIGDLKEDDPLRASLVEIHTAGERAASLTRQLLAFSRKQVLQPQDVDLNTVVANMEKMLRRLIGEDVRLVIATASTPYVVRADPRQLEQVLMNLAVNARDAMPGGGTLTIETRGIRVQDLGDGDSVTLAPGGWVLLDVRDTGVGMTQETIDRAFEPFFTTKGQGEGTGLGLPTVYGIVQQSGGTVWIQSAPGAGTTVTIALPELAAAPADTPQAQPDVPSGSEAVLVVEDDDMLRDMARLVLSSAGYDVMAASSGENALVLLEQRATPVALLLTDVVMPGMTGRELAEAVLARWPQTRVLYMSGYTDDAIVRHGVLDGVTEFINKPFGRADILAAVRRAIDGGPARRTEP